MITARQKKYRSTEKGRATHRKYMQSYMTRRSSERQKQGKPDIPSQTYHQKIRRKAIDLIGGPICNNCGCNIFAVLEINHINGGGRTSLKGKSTRFLHQAIIRETVNRADNNVLCRVCNALHYVESILKIQGHTVKWSTGGVAKLVDAQVC